MLIRSFYIRGGKEVLLFVLYLCGEEEIGFLFLKIWTGSVHRAVEECFMNRKIVHPMDMKGFPNRFVSVRNRLFGRRFPNSLKIHTVVEYIVSKPEVFVPDGVSSE